MDEDILMGLIGDLSNNISILDDTTKILISVTEDVGSNVSSLEDTIYKINESNEKYSRRMFWLSIAIVVLTFIMTLAVGVQIYLSFK